MIRIFRIWPLLLGERDGDPDAVAKALGLLDIRGDRMSAFSASSADIGVTPSCLAESSHVGADRDRRGGII